MIKKNIIPMNIIPMSWCFILLMLLVVRVQARELVIAFENTLQESASLSKVARVQMLVTNLANAGVPQAMFLVKTKGLDLKSRRALNIYSSGQQLIVNAGHGHDLMTKSDLYSYEIGLLKAKRLLRPYSAYKGHVNFSYVYEFGDPVLQAGLKKFLRERRFKPTYTNANELRGVDAYVNELFLKKMLNNRSLDMNEMEKLYVDLIVEMVQRQSAPAFLLMGYTPPQVLVLQENDLAAYFIAAAVERLTADGWTMASAEKVMANPLLNPVRAKGFGGNGYLSSITGLQDERVAFPRVLGTRKAYMDNFIRTRLPSLLE